MTKGGGGSKISKNWWRLLWTAPKKCVEKEGKKSSAEEDEIKFGLVSFQTVA